MLAKTQQQWVVLRVISRLLETPVGELVGYADLSTAAKVDVKTHRWVLSRAREVVIKESGVAFATVRSEGLRRLGGAVGVDDIGTRTFRRIHRATRRGSRRLFDLGRHANDMSPSDARTLNQRQCALGLIEHLTLARTVRALPDDPPPPSTNSFDAMRKVLGIQ